MLSALLLLLACRPTVPPEPAARQQVDSFAAPADARSWYLEAVVAEEAGDLVEARRALEWVARLDRRSPWPLIARGRLFERAGDATQAADAYRKALAIARVPEAHLGLGRVLLKSGRPAEAAPELAAAAGAGNDEAMALYVRALLELDRKDEAADRLSDWEPADRVEQTFRATELLKLDPSLAMDAWFALVDVDDPALADVDPWVRSARAACRLDEVQAWMEARHVASWDATWEAVVAEAGRVAPGCSEDLE